MKIAVVIISHNYGHFLNDAITSVLLQTLAPCEIIVVDDSSTDNTSVVAAGFSKSGVRYLRGEWGNVHQARKTGFDATNSDIVCFLDADDMLLDDYLRTGLSHFDDPHVGIVYSDVITFGEESQPRSFPRPHEIDLSIRNSCHAGSLVRRTAIETSGSFDANVTHQAHADWYIWRTIVRHGWRLAKNETSYQYRIHGNSMLRTADPVSYATQIIARNEPLTLWVPLSGRTDLWGTMKQWLLNQTWPRETIQLMFLDTSQDADFSAEIDSFAMRYDWPDVRHLRFDVGKPGIADEDRHQQPVKLHVQRAVSRIYRTMMMQVTTDFVCVVEDDIKPPVNALELLWNGMDEHVASVSGAYQSRYHSRFVAGDLNGNEFTTHGFGVEDVAWNGFGCVLLRTMALRKIGIQHAIPSGDYDVNFYDHLSRLNAVARINWDCHCEHHHSSGRRS